MAESLTITTSGAPGVAVVGKPYSFKPGVTGGVGPYTWTLKRDGTLPQGLSLNPKTGEVSGTATGSDTTASFDLVVTDSTESSHLTATSSYSIVVANPIEVAPIEPVSVMVNSPISVTPAPTHGHGTQTWSVDKPFPDGITLAPQTGKVTGSSTTPVDGTYTLKVMDDTGTATTDLDVVITDSLKISGSMPSGRADRPFTFTPVITGGLEPKTITVAGTIPDGLKFNQRDGSVSGTPSSASDVLISITVDDGSTKATLKDLRLTILEALNVQDIHVLKIPAMTGDTPFTVQYMVNAKNATWSVSPALPSGITLDHATGLLSATSPAVMDAKDYTVTATTTDGISASTVTTISVVKTIAVKPLEQVELYVGESYTKKLTAINNTGDVLWHVLTDGMLPVGITIGTDGASLTGTAVKAGTYEGTLCANDNLSRATTEFVFYVYDRIKPAVVHGDLSITNDKSFNLTATVEGGKAPVTLSSPNLPDGMDIANGNLTGTPAPGSYTIEIDATDVNGRGSRTFVSLVCVDVSDGALDKPALDFKNLCTDLISSIGAATTTPQWTDVASKFSIVCYKLMHDPRVLLLDFFKKVILAVTPDKMSGFVAGIQSLSGRDARVCMTLLTNFQMALTNPKNYVNHDSLLRVVPVQRIVYYLNALSGNLTS